MIRVRAFMIGAWVRSRRSGCPKASRQWLAACACLIAAMAHAETAAPARDAPLADVIVRRVARKCFARLIHASGYLVPRASAVVMLNAPGLRITEVRAKVGDAIKRGDVAARAAAQAPPSSPSADTPKPTADVAITSLASGTVLQSTAVVGQQTTEISKPLFTIAVDGVIEAAVAVPSVHVLDLQVGQAAHVTMGDGSVLQGSVRRTPAVIDPVDQMGTARLSVDGGGGLEPGRFVLATIEARRSCGVGAPIAALRRTSSGTTVQILQADVIRSRVVTLGLADETDAEVTSGLAEGELVVAGAGASREGDHVRPIYADPRDAR